MQTNSLTMYRMHCIVLQWLTFAAQRQGNPSVLARRNRATTILYMKITQQEHAQYFEVYRIKVSKIVTSASSNTKTEYSNKKNIYKPKNL